MPAWTGDHAFAPQRHPASLLILDIDYFKKYNDEYGHEAGDAVLRAIGQLLQTQVRGGDVACRFGGEEFVILMRMRRWSREGEGQTDP